ncbi:hypothetical protein GE21DRAFT_1348241 [Neurospora crassa]|nr:hypothetical protein GE21DRAFT_1348241 [Neurospora crassa]
MSDDQGDSPLSTISNVVGLLTFALGLLTLVVTFLSTTHSAEREIEDIREKLQARENHIREIEYHFEKLDREAHSDWEGSQSKIDFLMTLEKIKQHHQKARNALDTYSKKHYWWWYNRPDGNIPNLPGTFLSPPRGLLIEACSNGCRGRD